MPYTSTSDNVAPSTPGSVISLPCDKGRLTSATVQIMVTPATQPEGYVTLGIFDESTAEPHMVAQLAAGYCGTRHAVSWTGDIGLEPSMRVGALIKPLVACVARLSITTDPAV